MMTLKVALVHYHLRTGGVTKVILNQSQALQKLRHPHLVLSAGPAPQGIPHAEIPHLDYLTKDPNDPIPLYQTLLHQCEQHLGGPPDLWHIHNPSLGKNILFPQLIKDIAESQTPLILQAHDFAEDNRPSNYPLLAGEHIYPTAPQIHYAFINSRDRGLLESAGLDPNQTHLLPNAVAPPPINDSRRDNPNERLVLYPVRGIRRKNLGETVLLAALAPQNTRFAISLAPENPVWQAVHHHWQTFAQDHQLPIDFAVTDCLPPYPDEECNFQSWIQNSTHLLTTSIAEGFGLAFLEPAALQKPLIGRDLPEITTDFYHQGINPGHFYQQIPIPLTELGRERLHHEFQQQVSNSYQLYKQPLPADELQSGWQHLTQNDVVDFGALPESFQQELILKVLNKEAHPFQNLQAWLAEVLAETQPTATPDSLAHFSLEKSTQDLQELYQAALAAPHEEPSWLSKEKVLAQYLSSSRFHFLRS